MLSLLDVEGFDVAVDGDVLAVDHEGGRGGEEDGQVGDFVGLNETLERLAGYKLARDAVKRHVAQSTLRPGSRG